MTTLPSPDLALPWHEIKGAHACVPRKPADQLDVMFSLFEVMTCRLVCATDYTVNQDFWGIKAIDVQVYVRKRGGNVNMANINSLIVLMRIKNPHLYALHLRQKVNKQYQKQTKKSSLFWGGPHVSLCSRRTCSNIL